MILINKGQSNSVVLTLTERSTLVQPIYVFKFVNDITTEVIRFTADDISDAKERYNEFVIEENAVADVYNGIITLVDSGRYSYYIYEVANESPIDLEGETTLVEQGIVKVVGTNPVTFTGFDANDTITFEQ